MISVIVPVKDGGDDLRRCLDGIAKQRTSEQIETLVVDSGSTDGSLELARSSGARVLEVAPSDFRHGATRNFAADNARGELLVFTTQDAYATETHWLERLCAPLRSDEEVAGVYGRQIPYVDAIPPERFLLNFLYGPEARVQRVSDPSALALWTTLFSNSNSALRREFWSSIRLPTTSSGRRTRTGRAACSLRVTRFGTSPRRWFTIHTRTQFERPSSARSTRALRPTADSSPEVRPRLRSFVAKLCATPERSSRGSCEPASAAGSRTRSPMSWPSSWASGSEPSTSGFRRGSRCAARRFPPTGPLTSSSSEADRVPPV